MANNFITVLNILIKTLQRKISILHVECGPRLLFGQPKMFSDLDILFMVYIYEFRQRVVYIQIAPFF